MNVIIHTRCYLIMFVTNVCNCTCIIISSISIFKKSLQRENTLRTFGLPYLGFTQFKTSVHLTVYTIQNVCPSQGLHNSKLLSILRLTQFKTSVHVRVYTIQNVCPSQGLHNSKRLSILGFTQFKTSVHFRVYTIHNFSPSIQSINLTRVSKHIQYRCIQINCYSTYSIS